MRRTEAWQKAVVKHGAYRTRAYRVWIGMRARCTNPKHPAYAAYGGRGIRVSDRWLSFESFYRDMGDPPAGATIERKDNSKGYDPGNCRWASRRDQVRNRRNTIYLSYKGTKEPLWKWSEKLGISLHTLFCRLARGWSHERCIEEPLNTRMRNRLARVRRER